VKKIIHISDLHAGGGDSLDRQPEDVVSALIDEYDGRAEDYVVVITGDLVQVVSPENDEPFAAVQTELRKLEEAGFELVVVPGNHDLGTGSKADPRMVRIFEETFYGNVRRFPRLFCKGGIAFVVLNSMADELHFWDRWFAQGEIGDVQLDYMVHLFQSEEAKACEKRVLCLHHHPFDWLPLHQLRDKRALHRTLRDRVMSGEDPVTVDAILYGHNHRGKKRVDKWNIRRAYDAGSATLRRSTTALAPRSHIREINIENDDPETDRIILEP